MNDGMPPFEIRGRWQDGPHRPHRPRRARGDDPHQGSPRPRERADPCCSGQSNDAKRGGRRDREAAPRAQRGRPMAAVRRHPRSPVWQRRDGGGAAAARGRPRAGRHPNPRCARSHAICSSRRAQKRSPTPSAAPASVSSSLQWLEPHALGMPDGLDSYGVLIDAALEEFKGEDPGILLKAAWLEFECAYYSDSQTVQVERQGSYHKAAEYYSNAVAAARKPTGQGYRLSDLIWESANALGYAGGADDHLGVTLGELRAKCREAEAAQAVERGIYDGMPGRRRDRRRRRCAACSRRRRRSCPRSACCGRSTASSLARPEGGG